MGSPSSVEGILSGAKDTLAKANKFTESVEGNSTSSFAPQHHEFSKASYTMPHKARSATPDRDQEAKSLGEGLKAKMEQNETARKSLEQ